MFSHIVSEIALFIVVSTEIEFDDENRYIAVWDDTSYVSWDDALQYCMEMGTMLASIHNLSDQESLLVAARGTGANVTSTDYIWIGLNDTQDEGSFAWVDGSSLDYTNWAVGEPKSTDNDCVSIEDTEWYARPCMSGASGGTTLWVCNRPYGKLYIFLIFSIIRDSVLNSIRMVY